MKLEDTYHDCIVAVTMKHNVFLVDGDKEFYEMILDLEDNLDEVCDEEGRETFPSMPGLYRCDIEHWTEVIRDEDDNKYTEEDFLLKNIKQIDPFQANRKKR